MPTATVRLMRPDEATAVGRLTVDAYLADGFVTIDHFYATELARADHRAAHAEVYVYESDGELLGSVTFCPPGSPYQEIAAAGQGEFRMLAVSPTARKQGVASALVEKCIERCRQLGLRDLVICTMPTMTSAKALYERFGFVRAEALDWSPVPDVELIGYQATIG
jgi:ribosomal protein S18 acetylase RimI-like enzyme